MFENFKDASATVDGIRINAITAGAGEPLLLLHGHPQTHVIWHKVAEQLSQHFTVVAADLRGYGDSSKPDGGIDHILFLLALIVGSRRLRDVVLAATTFTVAHSITFLLAALGFVTVPAAVVEPVIALSIAAVAGWYLWRLIRRREHADELVVSTESHFALDRAGWARLAVVFCFGLIHGLGFAGALGIQEAFSWQLLVSLLIFNVGIEVVQLSIILVVFPLLVLLRRRAHRASLWISGVVTAGVLVMGLIWFVQRILAG